MLDVTLTVNGESQAFTPADMPAVQPDFAMGHPSRRGGFVFPRHVLGSQREALLRCTLSLVESGEPVANAMLDLHRPSREVL